MVESSACMWLTVIKHAEATLWLRWSLALWTGHSRRHKRLVRPGLLRSRFGAITLQRTLIFRVRFESLKSMSKRQGHLLKTKKTKPATKNLAGDKEWSVWKMGGCHDVPQFLPQHCGRTFDHGSYARGPGRILRNAIQVCQRLRRSNVTLAWFYPCQNERLSM